MLLADPLAEPPALTLPWGRIERRLRQLLPARAVVARRPELLTYDSDGLTLQRHEPPLVVLPETTEQVAAVLRLCQEEGVPFVARGSGTGLSGGAVAEQESLLVVTSRMRSVLALDLENQRITVQPGVINSWVTRAVAGDGFYYAPDPSSQVVCSIGGNVAENAGGVHCLKYGVTSNHVLELEVVLPDGRITRLGGSLAEMPGLDLRGVFIGSEGTLGIATAITLRLLPQPQTVQVLLADFPSMEAAGEAVRRVTEAGVLPAGMEIMDNFTINAVDDLFGCDEYPRDAAAVLLIELDGRLEEVSAAAERAMELCCQAGARSLRRAESEADRALLWKGRKSAFAAVGRITPTYYVQDGVVPRSALPQVLAAIEELSRRYCPAGGQRLPCRRRQSAPADPLRRQPDRRAGAGSGPRRRHPATLHRRRRQHHRRAWGGRRQALLHGLDVLPRRPGHDAAGAQRLRSRGPSQPRQALPHPSQLR